MSTITLKRSLTTSIPASLANGEPAYTANGDIFYIGSNGGIVAIGGKRTPGTLTANQALVANATGYLDVLKTANLYIGSVTVNTINAVANSTTLGAASNSELTTTWAIKQYVDLKALAGGGTSPGGSNTYVQYDDSGNFGGSAGFTFNATTNNIFIGNSALFGNSTANASVNSTQISLQSATGSVIINPGTVNAGANVQLSVTGLYLGNTTVNNSINSVGWSLNGGAVLANALGVWVGANVNLGLSGLSVGNSTVNALMLNTSWSLNGTQVVNSTGVLAGVLYGSQVNSAANLSFTGANVSIPNANLAVKDVTISGNLTILGTTTTVDATNLTVKDSTIKLADQNAGDAIDIGFYGLYNDGSNRYRGLMYDASNSNFLLFSNTLAEPTTTVDTSNTSLALATLRAYLNSGNLVVNSTTFTLGANSTWAVAIAANTLSLSTALPVSSGGTGLATVTSLGVLIGNGAGPMGIAAAVDGGVLQANSTATFFSAVLDGGTF